MDPGISPGGLVNIATKLSVLSRFDENTSKVLSLQVFSPQDKPMKKWY